MHRRLAGRVLGTVILEPYAGRHQPAACSSRLRFRLSDRATWRDLAWLLEVQTIGFAAAARRADRVPVPAAGLVGIAPAAAHGRRAPPGCWPARRTPNCSSGSASWRPRARTRVDHSAAELRRIERDLHDGAQAQLVALAMNLGLAQELVVRDPAAAAALIGEARQSSTTALAGTAVAGPRDPSAGAGRPRPDRRRRRAGAGPPATGRGRRRARRPAAGTGRIGGLLRGRRGADQQRQTRRRAERLGLDAARRQTLTVMVGDDGVGGAQLTPEGGLVGIERRLAAFDGTMSMASPLGGPTIVTIKVPCALQPGLTGSTRVTPD